MSYKCPCLPAYRDNSYSLPSTPLPVHAMRCIHLSLSIQVLGVLAAPAGNKFVCPSEDIISTKCFGPKDCLYQNNNNCNTYIQCTVDSGERTGTPVVMPCPAGFLWNDHQRSCDYPAFSTCRDPIQEANATADEELPPANSTLDTSFDCDTAGAKQDCMELECIYANPKSSKSYVQCTDGLAYIVQCKADQVYQDTTKSCEVRRG